jgi:predicted kinase
MTRLIIIRGLPGSGKSTLAKKEYAGFLIYEPDHLFEDCNNRYRFEPQLFEDAHKFCYNMVDAALAREENVVICDVFPTYSSYEKYIDLAEYHDAEAEIVNCVDTFKNCHHVPKFVLDRMRNVWED